MIDSCLQSINFDSSTRAASFKELNVLQNQAQKFNHTSNNAPTKVNCKAEL